MSVIYLVTGAAGHLGNVIANMLASGGEQVRALIMEKDKEITYLLEGVERQIGDVLDLKTLELFFEHKEGEELIVIHCAGIVSISSSFQQMVYDVNVCGTQNIVKMSLIHPVKKFVYISSVHAIPELPQMEIMKETDQFSPDQVRGNYAKTKAEATAYVLAAGKMGLNTTVIHPSGICGPFDYGNGHTNQLIIDYYKGRLISAVTGGYDFVDVRDVANGVIASCKTETSGNCYILSNRFVPVKELLSMLAEITGRKKIKFCMPMWFAKMTAPFSEVYYKLRKQTPLYTAYSLYTLSSNSKFSHEKADRELGYLARPFKETLRDTVEWLTKQGKI